MGNGSLKPGDAVADRARDEFDRNRRERDLATEKLRQRADMRSNPDEEEDTGVIELRAREALATKPDSDAPKAAKGIATVLNAVRTPAQAIVAVAIVVAIVVLILQGVKLW